MCSGGAVLATDTDTRNALRRAVRFAVCASLCIYDIHRLSKMDEAELEARQSEVHTQVATRLLRMAQSSGGLYVKLGQHVSTLKYIVPDEYTTTLKQLQDRACVSPWPDVKAQLERDLGGPLERSFQSFEQRPFAHASIAQVHRAVTLSGRPVAVKVQHPGIDKQQVTDIHLLRWASEVIGWIWEDHAYAWLFPEFEDTVAMELDFVQEATNGERTKQMVQRIPRVTVPEVVLELTSEKMLTMEFIEGCRVDDLAELNKHKIDPKQVAAAVLQAHTELLFVQGFFNVDPHPGNIIIRPRPDKGTGEFDVVLIDHGMYRRLEPVFRRAYCSLW